MDVFWRVGEGDYCKKGRGDLNPENRLRERGANTQHLYLALLFEISIFWVRNPSISAGKSTIAKSQFAKLANSNVFLL